MRSKYLVAYTSLGLAGLFKGKAGGIFPGAVIGNAARFVVHFISGMTIYRIYEPTEVLNFGTFDDATVYSLVYNAAYMIPCMILTLAVAAVLYKPLKNTTQAMTCYNKHKKCTCTTGAFFIVTGFDKIRHSIGDILVLPGFIGKY